MKQKLIELRDELNKKVEIGKNLVKWKASDIKYWYDEHKEEIMTLGPAAIEALAVIVSTIAGSKKVKEEKYLKDRYIYDRPNGHSYELKRKPKSKELLQLDQRRENGEMLGSILNDMNLLK